MSIIKSSSFNNKIGENLNNFTIRKSKNLFKNNNIDVKNFNKEISKEKYKILKHLKTKTLKKKYMRKYCRKKIVNEKKLKTKKVEKHLSKYRNVTKI
jgi:hypothetical protein